MTVGDAESVELCGGTHLERAATIGALRITSESAIGSGVRRVEAVTGPRAVEAARQQEDLVLELSRELGVPVADLPRRIKQILKDVQELKSEVGRLRRGGGGANGVDVLINEAKAIGAEKVIEAKLESGQVDDARALMDELTKKRRIGVAILAVPGERPAFVIGVREDLVTSKGLKAGDIAKEVGKACGGGGGGRDCRPKPAPRTRPRSSWVSTLLKPRSARNSLNCHRDSTFRIPRRSLLPVRFGAEPA